MISYIHNDHGRKRAGTANFNENMTPQQPFPLLGRE